MFLNYRRGDESSAAIRRVGDIHVILTRLRTLLCNQNSHYNITTAEILPCSQLAYIAFDI